MTEPFTTATTGLPIRAISASRPAYARGASYASIPAAFAAATLEAGAKRLLAGAGDADDPGLGVGIGAHKGAAQRGDQLAGERIALRRSIEDQPARRTPRLFAKPGHGTARCRGTGAASSGEHGADDRNETIDVALGEIMLAASFEQRPVHRLDVRALIIVEEEIRHPHLQRLGDGGERLQVR